MKIKPYGDTFSDGKIQISFTLPVANNARGVQAAKELVKGMGIIDPQVVHSESLSDDFSFYIVYGSTKTLIDYDKIKVEEITSEALSKEEIEKVIGEVDIFDRTTSSPTAPGQLPSHYSPRKPLHILYEGINNNIDFSNSNFFNFKLTFIIYL